MIRRSKVVNVKLMAMMMIMVMLIFTPSFIFDYFDEEKNDLSLDANITVVNVPFAVCICSFISYREKTDMKINFDFDLFFFKLKKRL